MGKKSVSLKTIAHELGVSINTVSHALRDMDDISPKMKSLVRNKAIELGYSRSNVSLNQRDDYLPIVAVIVNSFENLYYNLICKEIAALAEENNDFEFVLLYTNSETYLNENDIKNCIVQRIDCIVSHLPPTEGALQLARLNGVNIVILGSMEETGAVDNVFADNEIGCALAAKYLLSFQKSKYIFVGTDYFLCKKRFEMFRSELLKVGQKDVLYFNCDREDASFLYAHIKRGYRNIFFYNDSLAYKMLNRFDELGLDVQGTYPDLRYIGFDGLCAEIWGLRRIPSVGIDFKEYAAKTYMLIKNRMENPNDPPKKSILTPYIINTIK